MQKSILTLSLILLTAVSAFAGPPQRGYRGFAEWDNGITSYPQVDDSRKTVWFTGVSTSHGYQLNPNLFVGAGLMVEKSTQFGFWTLPVFTQVRTDQKWGKFTPFGDLRIGYNCCDGGGIYFSPTVGYRFNWGRRMNLNLGIGLTLRGSSIKQYNIEYDPDDNEMAYISYIGKKHQTKAMFTIRVGIDF